jgi:hypothetical protein
MSPGHPDEPQRPRIASGRLSKFEADEAGVALDEIDRSPNMAVPFVRTPARCGHHLRGPASRPISTAVTSSSRPLDQRAAMVVFLSRPFPSLVSAACRPHAQTRRLSVMPPSAKCPRGTGILEIRLRRPGTRYFVSPGVPTQEARPSIGRELRGEGCNFGMQPEAFRNPLSSI